MYNSSLYVDAENLLDKAKHAILSTMNQWPAIFPKCNTLNLYVEADKTVLWRMWAEHTYPSLKIIIKGVQHFTTKGSKNSADISLALDVLADFLKGRISHAAILSDDSDFMNLFSKISVEIDKLENGLCPFLWFQTSREDTKSKTLNQFLPSCYLQIVDISDSPAKSRKKSASEYIQSDNLKKENSPKLQENKERLIAIKIVQELPVGQFRSTECKKIIKKFFPENQLYKLDSAPFGTQFNNHIWPELERLGVTIPNPKRKSKRYEITEEAKRKITSGI